jgi:HEAT repeats
MRSRVIHAGLLACLPFISLQVIAQTRLAQVFTDLHSSDASVRDAANSQIVKAVENEMPNIEQDTKLLCSSLSDTDLYIRQQASGILSVIAQMHPEHQSVVRSCSTALIQSASDSANRVRLNSLAALAIESGGPPQEARPVFIAALVDPSSAFQGLGAFGLLKLGGNDNFQMVANAVRQTKTEDEKVALMHAITKADVGNDALFTAVSNLLYDPNSDVQQAAVEAIGASASNKAKAVTMLENFAETSNGSRMVRQAAAERAAQLSTK